MIFFYFFKVVFVAFVYNYAYICYDGIMYVLIAKWWQSENLRTG